MRALQSGLHDGGMEHLLIQEYTLPRDLDLNHPWESRCRCNTGALIFRLGFWIQFCHTYLRTMRQMSSLSPPTQDPKPEILNPKS